MYERDVKKKTINEMENLHLKVSTVSWLFSSVHLLASFVKRFFWPKTKAKGGDCWVWNCQYLRVQCFIRRGLLRR